MRAAQTHKTTRARGFRKSPTDAETKLWLLLRNRQLGGWKFVRQHPIGPYFVDFVCRERRLIVELDGGQHVESEHDARRDLFLTKQGYRVLRIWNNDLLQNPEGVQEMLLAELEQSR